MSDYAITPDGDNDGAVYILFGTAVARRFTQFCSSKPDEDMWMAIALAASQVFRVIAEAEGDVLTALDDFHALEEAMGR